MTASNAVRKFGILSLGIALCLLASLIVSNAFAAQVTLAWNPNTESDLAGYRVHSGSTSGSYAMHIDVHNVNTYTVTGLTDGQTYYFAATAYNSAGNESGFSNQVSYSVPAANGAPSTPAVPSGPASASVNAPVSFSTSATDPNGDSVQYCYDWGDGVVSNLGPASQSHYWTTAGQYGVKAQASDSRGALSAWSAPKTITIARAQNQTPSANAGADKVVNAGAVVALQGSGSDSDDGIAAYQWRQVSGTSVALTGAQTQQASFTAPNSAAGGTALVFELKVTDRGGLSATDTVTVTVQPTGQASYSLWSNSTVPAVASNAADSQAVELGMKFKTEVNGYVTGVRFYKSPTNTGQHLGSLWSRDGKLLSSVIFSNETASGWQEAAFPAAVAVNANTAYVISYHTDTGHFSYNDQYFASAATARSPLRALANGEDGPNGVYKYGASGYPTQTYSSRNYWVDVVFKTAGSSPAAPASAGTSMGTQATAAPTASSAAGTSVTGVSATAATVAAQTAGNGLTSGSTSQATSPAEVPSASSAGSGAKQPPNAPIPVSPANDEVVTVQPVLKTSVFQHPNPIEIHAETRWQVFRDDDSACVLDIQTSSSLTSLTVPKLVLEEGAAYFWRALFIDGDGDVSEWSDYGNFSTETTEADLNANGIPDLQEVGRSADLDKDGVRDYRQPDIKSIKMQGTGRQIGVSIKGCPTALAIEAVESEDPQQPGSAASSKPGSMPFGLINFRIAVAKPGDPALVKLYFSQAVPASSKWYKYDSTAGRWYDFSTYAKFAADRFSVTLTLRDGGPGDADGVANGVIVDPGGIVELRDEVVSDSEPRAAPAPAETPAGVSSRHGK